MTKTLAPEVRSQFAKRLKDTRVQSGFPRARYFAKSLGIEENRYTRYERAEVEPSLTLIHKMCETLRVSPNELMGFAEYAGPAAIPAFAEETRRGKLRTPRMIPRDMLGCWPGVLRPRLLPCATSTAQSRRPRSIRSQRA